MRARFFLLSLLLATAMHAQSFPVNNIVFAGVPESDRASLLEMSGLKPGATLSKEQIEAALQKLADTGFYSDLGYQVSGGTLTVTLTAAAHSQAVPVRFSNFVWWTAPELDALLRTRVPGYSGTLSANTPLAETVRRALEKVCAERGIPAEVDVVARGGALVFFINKPAIVSGDLDVAVVTPVEGETFAAFREGLHGQEFDEVLTRQAILGDTKSIYANAGYLHAVVDAPRFSPPRADGGRFWVDAAVQVTPGEMFRVGKVQVSGTEGADADDVKRMTKLHSGEPASPLRARLMRDGLAMALQANGFLDASVQAAEQEDSAAHTVSYSFAAHAGTVYKLARISVLETLPPAIGQALRKDAALKDGVVAGHAVLAEAHRILRDQHAPEGISVRLEPDHTEHTATLVVATPRSRGMVE